MEDMVEKIRYAKFGPHRPSYRDNMSFLKIFFGPKVINKKFHFSDFSGLKTTVSHGFSAKFFLHWIAYLDVWNVWKNQGVFRHFALIKFSKFETGFFSKKIWLGIYWCILYCIICTEIFLAGHPMFHSIVVTMTLLRGLYFALF